jgi:glycosyltransferase involved in cell wall biosynthesis
MIIIDIQKDGKSIMIRILQIGLSQTYYGTESVIMSLYRNIDRTVIQFDFLLDHNVGKLEYEKEILNLGGRIYREYYKRKERYLSDYISPADFFDRHGDIAGVHYNLNNHTPYIRYIKEAKKRNIPIRVVHSHSSGHFKKNLSIKEEIYEKYAKYISGKCSNKLLSCSYDAGYFNFGKYKFDVYPNAIDTDKFAFSLDNREEVRAKFKLEGRKVIGFVGRLQREKNPFYLLKIMEKIEDENIILLIFGEGELYGDLKHTIEEKKLKNVVLMGKHNDISKWFSAMDILLLPSIFEGLGVALIEAQTAGVVCIASDVVPRETNITDLVTYISLDNISDWIENIVSTSNAKNRIKYRKMVEDAGYGIKQSTQNLTDIYLTLMHENE